MELPLGGGGVALIDDADAELVRRHRWYRHAAKPGRFYARARIDGRDVYLHRFLMGEPPGGNVDHKNRDGLDCRRGNLRVATVAQNAHNQAVRRNNTSGFKGVSQCRRTGRWRAKILHEYTVHRLGTFATAEAAAAAYDEAARRLHGEFAVTNGC